MSGQGIKKIDWGEPRPTKQELQEIDDYHNWAEWTDQTAQQEKVEE